MRQIDARLLAFSGFFRGAAVALALFVLSACQSSNMESDAYGNFEADEVIVSAEENGRLLEFRMDEGDRLERGQIAGVIDTTMLVISLKQIEASRASVKARIISLNKTLEVQQARIEMLQKEVDRITNLHKEGAATAQQYDKVTGQMKVALAEKAQVYSQRSALLAEEQMVNARSEAVLEQQNRCYIKAPVSGIILQKYAQEGELVVAGKPLFKMAETRELILRAFVSGSQLQKVRIGQTVGVRFDLDREKTGEVEGVVTWVASTAEFTPKIIQTREERVDLVYAVKVRVPNARGRLKIGMPGEVWFKEYPHD